jgi:glycosyltransferase involved in cell wall biosynthesis
MKVLHVIWDIDQGGAQTYLNSLVRSCKEQGLHSEVAVLTLPGIYSDYLMEHTDNVHYLNFLHGFDCFGAARLYLTTKKIAPDVIHVHANSIISTLALLLTRIPLVYTEHGAGVMRDYPRGRLIEYLLYSILGKWINIFIAVSNAMKEKMVNANYKIANKIIIIPNGVDCNLLISQNILHKIPDQLLNTQVYKIGIAGRLTKIKGIDLFLATAEEVVKRHANVFFFVIGDGELKTELHDMMTKLGLNDYVFFLGYRDDAVALMRHFDVYLMTSHYESFGLTIIESMAQEVPVVAAKAVGPFAEIVDHTIDGILVASREPVALADAIIRLLADEPKRKQMGINAGQKVRERFSIDKNASTVRDCYKKICSNTNYT